jgi:hypothetical protein
LGWRWAGPQAKQTIGSGIPQDKSVHIGHNDAFSHAVQNGLQNGGLLCEVLFSAIALGDIEHGGPTGNALPIGISNHRGVQQHGHQVAVLSDHLRFKVTGPPVDDKLREMSQKPPRAVGSQHIGKDEVAHHFGTLVPQPI